MIMQANLVVTKLRLTETSKRQATEMIDKVMAFNSAFDKVIQRGLPPFWNGNNDLIPLEAYKEKLTVAREYCASINALAP